LRRGAIIAEALCAQPPENPVRLSFDESIQRVARSRNSAAD
jgi:hypothetical protein